MKLAAGLRGWGLLSLLCTVIGSATPDPTYTLSHRFSSAAAYHTFSTFTLPLSLSSHSTHIDLEPESQVQVRELTRGGGEGEGERYYLQLSGDGVNLETSTKACYLFHSHTPQVNIHLSSHGTPISLSLIIPSTPSNGSCPPSPSPPSSAQYPTNIQIRTTSPVLLKSPQLAGPINTDSTGQPVAPPPEKSFLQKYWLPIAGLAVFALSQLGDPAPPGGQGGGGRPK